MDHPLTEAEVPEEERREIISRHLTSEGVVVYARTESGKLDMWLVPYEPGRAGVATDAA